MLTLDADQTSLVADDSKDYRWYFTITDANGLDLFPAAGYSTDFSVNTGWTFTNGAAISGGVLTFPIDAGLTHQAYRTLTAAQGQRSGQRWTVSYEVISNDAVGPTGLYLIGDTTDKINAETITISSEVGVHSYEISGNFTGTAIIVCIQVSGAITSGSIVIDNFSAIPARPVIMDFSGIDLKRNTSETGIVAPSEVTFTISDAGDVIGYSNLKGGTVLIELYITSPTVAEHKIAGWMFKIKTAEPGYQQIKIVAQDFLQDYLQGYYPNTRLPEEIFPSSRTYVGDMVCVPVPFGSAYVPLRDVFITDAGYLMLGDPAHTYTIEKIRSPRSVGMKTEWDSASFSFTQSTKADADAVDWRVFQTIIADGNKDGTVDTHGFWNVGPSLDPPVLFSRDDTATTTNPADIIAFVLEDMGVPSAMIDDGVGGSFAAAHAIFDAYTVPLVFNGAFWYKQDRQKVLAQLLTQCHACLDVGETIKMRVLSKTSKATITDADVLRTSDQGPGSFQYQDIVNEDLSDAAYGAYQETGEAQDELKQVLVSTGGAATVISSEVIPCPFVQDSRDVKRIVTLALQRKLGKVASVNWLNKGTALALQPDDILTVNDSNYGGSHTVLIDSMKINKDLSIQFSCTKFKQALSDWADLSPTTQVIPVDDTTHPWSPVISGPDSPGTPIPLNAIADRLRVGNGAANYILIEPADPRISLYNSGEKWRVGNLNGYLGVASDLFGLGIGESGAGKANLIYDVTDGLRLRSGTTNVVNIDNAGNITISGGIIASTIAIGTSPNWFNVDVSGNIWSGQDTLANAQANTFAVTNAGVLSAITGYLGGSTNGWAITAGLLSAIGTGIIQTSTSANTGIKLDSTSLRGYNGTVQTINIATDGSGWVGLTGTKAISWTAAGAATIAGYTATATALYAGTTSTRIQLDTAAGIHLGATAFADAPFRVSLAGALTATSATITGTVTSTSGTIGGFTLAANQLSSGTDADFVGLSSGGTNAIWVGDSTFADAKFSVTSAGVLKAISGTIGGWTLAATKLSTGTDADYIGFEPSVGIQLGDSTFADAPFSVTKAGVLKATSATITGSITASSGSVGSFTIGTYLYTGSKTAYNDAEAGVHLGSDGIGIGNNVFTVSAAGALVATSATITGVITANTGKIGGADGWVISANYIKDVAGVTGLSSVVTAGDDIRFWAGHATPASAPFYVTEAGALVATSATITGAITATSGTFTGTVNATAGKFGTSTNYWSVGATGLTATSASTDVMINFGKTDFTNTDTGFILGYDFSASAAKFLIGNSTSYLNWDGAALTYTKGTLAETTIQMYTSVASLKTAATALDGAPDGVAGIKITYEGIYAGSATQTTADANVRILATGAAYFSGTITAGAGAIGGFTIGADYIKDAADSFGLASTVTGGDDVRFWAGDTFANRATADFRITEAGALYASSATIVGDYKTSATVGTTKGVHLSVVDNELYFYGDRGDTTIQKLISMGTISADSSTYLLSLGTNTYAGRGIYFQGTGTTGISTYIDGASPVGVRITSFGTAVGDPIGIDIGVSAAKAATTFSALRGINLNYGMTQGSIGGTITNCYGIFLSPQSGDATPGIITNLYDLFIDTASLGDPAHPGTITTHYAIYQEDAAAINYFAGYIQALDGIHVGGTSDPGADNLLVDGTLHVDGIQTSAGIIMDNNATIGQAAGPLIAFDDTNNYLEITGCNVGIGTTAPTAMLELSKAGGMEVKLTNTTNSSYSALGNDINGPYIYASSGQPLRIFTGGTEYMRITSTGNVGIGTTNPGGPLEIYRDGGEPDITAGGLALTRYHSGSNYRGGAIYSRYITGAGDNLVFGVTGADGKNPYSDIDQARMVIGSSGNVGIGTTNPSGKLDIVSGANRWTMFDGDSSVTPGISFSTSGGKAGIVQAGTGGAGFVYDQTGFFQIGKDAKVNITDGLSNGGTGVLRVSSAGGLSLGSSYLTSDPGAGSMIISGKVGIGSISPVSLTEIQGGLTTVGAVLTLGSKETSTVANDVLGRINFYAPLDASGTDAILPGASIAAIATGTFSASVNSTALCFQTGNSETAVGQTRMQIGATGGVTVGNSGTDPGLDNLLVDGTIAATSIKASGAEQLKFWTYTHTVTAAEVTATYLDVTITAVTLTKVRGISTVDWTNDMGAIDVTDYSLVARLTSTTNLRVYLSGSIVATDDVISITIIEAV